MLRFYHTAQSTPAGVDASLPPLLNKAYETDLPALVVAPTAARAGRLDETLWSYQATSFLPHGTPEKAPENQPILLVNLEEHPSLTPYLQRLAKPRLPMVLAGAEACIPDLLASEAGKIFYLFSSLSADVERARALYKHYKAAGTTLAYFQQTDAGWQQK